MYWKRPYFQSLGGKIKIFSPVSHSHFNLSHHLLQRANRLWCALWIIHSDGYSVHSYFVIYFRYSAYKESAFPADWSTARVSLEASSWLPSQNWRICLNRRKGISITLLVSQRIEKNMSTWRQMYVEAVSIGQAGLRFSLRGWNQKFCNVRFLF